MKIRAENEKLLFTVSAILKMSLKRNPSLVNNPKRAPSFAPGKTNSPRARRLPKRLGGFLGSLYEYQPRAQFVARDLMLIGRVKWRK